MGMLSMETARSVTFHFMSIGQLFFAYSARHTYVRPLANPYLHASILICGALQLIIGCWSVSALALGAVTFSAQLWGVVIVTALAAWGTSELVNRALWRNDPR